jgi:hypothetical protein
MSCRRSGCSSCRASSWRSTHTLQADAATVLNVSEDHLDRYAGLDDYAASQGARLPGAACRCSIAMTRYPPGRHWPDRTQVVTFGLDAPRARRRLRPLRRLAHARREPLIATERVATRRYSQRGQRAGGAGAVRSGRSRPAAPVAGARRFQSGLPHRVEWVAERSTASASTTTPRAPTSAPRWRPSRAWVARWRSSSAATARDRTSRPSTGDAEQHGRAVALIGRDAPADRCGGACGSPFRPSLCRHVRGRALVRRPGAGRRRRAAVAGLCQLRHVPQLRTSRRGLHRRGARSAAGRLPDVASARRRAPDAVGNRSALLWSGLILLLIGMVMVYSASIATAEAGSHDRAIIRPIS